MTGKFYNPKSFAPAIYMPTWLLQVPTSKVSNNAKILYGRISQWANQKGDVFRSTRQLSQELGTPPRTLERHIKELRDKKLIETYIPLPGGVNHFKFLNHPWMHEEINEHLVYKSDTYDPPSELRTPPVKTAYTPTSDLRIINNKEIKEIKLCGETSFQHTKVSEKIENQNPEPQTPKTLKKITIEKTTLADEEIKNLFEEKFRDYTITLQQLFDNCQQHYEQKSLWATKEKFTRWIKNERIENYEKKSKVKLVRDSTIIPFDKHEEKSARLYEKYRGTIAEKIHFPTQEALQAAKKCSEDLKGIKEFIFHHINLFNADKRTNPIIPNFCTNDYA